MSYRDPCLRQHCRERTTADALQGIQFRPNSGSPGREGERRAYAPKLIRSLWISTHINLLPSAFATGRTFHKPLPVGNPERDLCDQYPE